jgi:hypothetical protein
MFLCFLPAECNVFGRVAKIMPAAIKREWSQNEIGGQTGMFGNAHLSAMKCAQNNVQDITGGKVIEVLIDELADSAWVAAVKLGLLSVHFHATAQVSGGGNRVNGNNFVDAHFLEHINRQRIRYAAIHVKFVTHFDGCTGAWNCAAGVNGRRYFAGRKDGPFKTGQIRSDNAQGADELGEMGVANGTLQAAFNFFAPEKTLAWKNERID